MLFFYIAHWVGIFLFVSVSTTPVGSAESQRDIHGNVRSPRPKYGPELRLIMASICYLEYFSVEPHEMENLFTMILLVGNGYIRRGAPLGMKNAGAC